MGAGTGERMDPDPRRERRTQGAHRGSNKSVAMSEVARSNIRANCASDLIAAMRRAARQEQFLEVVSAEEARARFARHLDFSPLPGERVALAAALGRILA